MSKKKAVNVSVPTSEITEERLLSFAEEYDAKEKARLKERNRMHWKEVAFYQAWREQNPEAKWIPALFLKHEKGK